MKAVQISNGIVQNVINANESFCTKWLDGTLGAPVDPLTDTFILVADGVFVQTGDTWDGTFIARSDGSCPQMPKDSMTIRKASAKTPPALPTPAKPDLVVSKPDPSKLSDVSPK